MAQGSQSSAFRLGEKAGGGNDPLQMYLADLFTVQANVVGYPAISIPNGTDDANLPIGLQLMAPPFAEEALVALAKSLEINNE